MNAYQPDSRKFRAMSWLWLKRNTGLGWFGLLLHKMANPKELDE